MVLLLLLFGRPVRYVASHRMLVHRPATQSLPAAYNSLGAPCPSPRAGALDLEIPRLERTERAGPPATCGPVPWSRLRPQHGGTIGVPGKPPQVLGARVAGRLEVHRLGSESLSSLGLHGKRLRLRM